MKTEFGVFLITAGLAFGQLPAANSVLDQDAVHEIRLTFAQADWWEQLTANYRDNQDDIPYIPVSLAWGEHAFEQIGVRFKGNSSYNGANTPKKPFRIKLNEFVKGQKLDGTASFSLSNAWGDPSFVREKAYYEMAAAAGLKAPRSNFAALYINGTYWGLYVLTEVVNSDFLKNHFGKGDDGGNLYKGNIGASFSYLGQDPAAYRRVFEKQSNEEADDWSDLIEFTRLLEQTPVEELPARLTPLVDLDSVLTALALDNLTANLDSYAGMGQNFYVYRRPSDNRWVWIPWDPSLAFAAQGFGLTTQQMKELPLEWVTTGGGPGGGRGFPGAPGAPAGQNARPLATRLWQVPEYKQRYREIYQRLVDRVFLADMMLARMNVLRDRIRPWVAGDTQKLVTMEQFEQALTVDQAAPALAPGAPGGPGGAGPGASAPGIQPFIEGRIVSVKSQLAGQTAAANAAQ